MSLFAIGASLFDVASSFSAASEANREAKRQADMELQKTAEEARRTIRENQQVQSLTRAIMGASGTTGEGSQQYYLQDMQAEQTRQVNWLKKVGSYNAESIRRTGSSLAEQYRAQGIGKLFQAGANMFGG
ncbi:MAG: hypothetical protein [Podoviridae sp. ctpVR23]|nr:MAG: hypothetical protein [Podoviridae sp. ctpVR23]